MTDSATVDLSEFNRLRTEIDSRTKLSNQLVYYELTVLGAGVAVFEKYPDVQLALAAVSTSLWLFWIDHTTQVYKIAGYISLEIGVRLRAAYAGVLGWEEFLRKIDQGGETAEYALYRNVRGRRITIMRTHWVSDYIRFFFMGTTIILLLIYLGEKLWKLFVIGPLAILPHLSVLHGVRAIALIAVVGLLLFAYRQFNQFLQTAATIQDAILLAAASTETGTRQQQANIDRAHAGTPVGLDEGSDDE